MATAFELAPLFDHTSVGIERAWMVLVCVLPVWTIPTATFFHRARSSAQQMRQFSRKEPTTFVHIEVLGTNDASSKGSLSVQTFRGRVTPKSFGDRSSWLHLACCQEHHDSSCDKHTLGSGASIPCRHKAVDSPQKIMTFYSYHF